ncbi:MAG TPA: VOC family protein [Thermomicrobiales bacterium]|jgi:catechol 2,3-dioxygenase-like lactoylglutathione lyase family enzyme|nr:VOC family protein [Thermomicrobiales bacterium]
MSVPGGLRLNSVVLNSPDPVALANFYARLLGWPYRADPDPEWVMLDNPAGGIRMSFQKESIYVRPVWPAAPGEQQMMQHLDIFVDDMDAACAHAAACGATLDPFQPQDDVRVHRDPDGHVFCLFTEE